MSLWMLGGSLVAVLLLAFAARAMDLGGDVRIAGRDEALRIAEGEGFMPSDIAVDRAGIAAIARDAGGRHLLIRRHGVHFVARVLRAPLDARLDQNFLTLGTNERLFGRVTLDLGSAASNWAASLRSVR